MKVAEFGKTSDGRTITSYTLTGGRGAELEVLDYGGKVQEITFLNISDPVYTYAFRYGTFGL